jgi:hypothetical protein
MNSEDAEEWTQSLGQILGGSWRQIHLAQKLGVPKALGLSLEEWVKTRLGAYARLPVEERKEAVKELASEGTPQREIAKVLGVAHTTVQRDSGTNVPPKNDPPKEEKKDSGTNVPTNQKPSESEQRKAEMAAAEKLSQEFLTQGVASFVMAFDPGLMDSDVLAKRIAEKVDLNYMRQLLDENLTKDRLAACILVASKFKKYVRLKK